MDETSQPVNLATMLPDIAIVEARPEVTVVGSDKGGVGKTTIARAYDDYLTQRAKRHSVFDGEFPRGDLQRFIPNAKIINVRRVEDQMTVFDSIEGTSLIDIKAGQFTDFLDDLGKVKLLNDVRAGKLNLNLLHLIGPNVASLTEIAEIAKTIGKGVRHLIVKNYINEGGFEEWTTDPRFAQTLKDLAASTITIPHLTPRACAQVQKEGLSFYRYAQAGESRMLRGYVGDWLDAVWAEFDRVGLA
jgi:hypothetical protein